MEKERKNKKRKNITLWITWIILIIIILVIFIFLFYEYSSITGEAVASEKFICSDTDNGKDYTVQGIIKQGDLIKGTDYCTDDTRLKEYYCMTKTSTNHNYYECPYKCVKGACVEDNTEEQNTDTGINQITDEENLVNTATDNGVESEITPEPKIGFFKRIINNIKGLFKKG